MTGRQNKLPASPRPSRATGLRILPASPGWLPTRFFQADSAGSSPGDYHPSGPNINVTAVEIEDRREGSEFLESRRLPQERSGIVIDPSQGPVEPGHGGIAQ